MNCGSCSHLVKIYSETGISYSDKAVADKMAKFQGLFVQDRPSGYYLVRFEGCKCSNRLSFNFNKFVDTDYICDIISKSVCDGQLTIKGV